MRITDVKAVPIANSRGQPTIKIIVNKFGTGSAPSGASTGKYEAIDYPKGLNFSMKLVHKVVSKSLRGFKFEKFSDLEEIEKLLPKNFGANPTIALEFALLNALAKSKGLPLWMILNPRAIRLPRILANVIGGGAHTPEKSRTLDIQEVLISPRTGRIADDVSATLEFYNDLGIVIGAKKQTDEGAWIPLQSFEDVFETVLKVTGYEHGMDVAASQFYKKGRYYWTKLWGSDAEVADTKKQIDIITSLAKEYNLFYIEDPLHQGDFSGFAELRKKLPDVMICGDDLTATNLVRLKKAIKMKSINAMIVKPNQAGSLIKTKEVFDYAVKHDITPVISHRSGETMDATIAQIAFAWQAPFVKFGIGQRERMAKLHELIGIEKSL
ncbi:MAG: enolase C-terminal domain-like protein [archaeon]